MGSLAQEPRAYSFTRPEARYACHNLRGRVRMVKIVGSVDGRQVPCTQTASSVMDQSMRLCLGLLAHR
jgi:hypothetical protein